MWKWTPRKRTSPIKRELEFILRKWHFFVSLHYTPHLLWVHWEKMAEISSAPDCTVLFETDMLTKLSSTWRHVCFNVHFPPEECSNPWAFFQECLVPAYVAEIRSHSYSTWWRSKEAILMRRRCWSGNPFNNDLRWTGASRKLQCLPGVH